MRIKKEDEDLISPIKKIYKKIYKFFFSKKSIITYYLIIILSVFLIGIFSGLVIFGFFGTFDEPSENALRIIHAFGIYGLGDFQSKINDIKRENFKIPINFIKGKFTKVEKIFINIDFESYQKIKHKRSQAIGSLGFKGVIEPSAGILISSGEDYVPATITYKGEEVSAKIRLKGDLTDHLTSDKWSYRIKIKNNEELFGMRVFSIQNPKSRGNIKEWIYHKLLLEEGVLSMRYEFINVNINGENKGIYAIEENFDKLLIEHNRRREGVIIKFNEDNMWKEILNSSNRLSNYDDYFAYMDENFLNWFYNSEIEPFDNKIFEDESLSRQFNEAKNLLESFRTGSLTTSDVFDIDKLAKYFALNTMIGSYHASTWNNIRFYYNPITSKLEPIGFNAELSSSSIEVLEYYISDYEKDSSSYPTLEKLFFRDAIFFKKYMEELNIVSQINYLTTFFMKYSDEIEKNINILYKDNPSYHFSSEKFYENQKEIQNMLNSIKGVNVFLQETNQNEVILSIANIDSFPIEILSVNFNEYHLPIKNSQTLIFPKKINSIPKYNKFNFIFPEDFSNDNNVEPILKINYRILGRGDIISQDIYPWNYPDVGFIESDFLRRETNFSNFYFIKLENKLKKIIFDKGDHILETDLIIPPGYKVFIYGGTSIDFRNKSTIVSYSSMKLIGDENNPVEFFSSDFSGQGISILKSVEKSIFNNVIISDMTNPSKNGWEMSGAVNFYDSAVDFFNVKIINSKSEDGLNIINSEFAIKNLTMENCFSDCFDSDFSNGMLESSIFIKCGNDCIDFSGSKVDLNNLKLIDISDKGISIGEESEIYAKKITIEGNKNQKGLIGIASKDSSNFYINDIFISNMEYGFAIYQKKSEFSGAEIISENILILDTERKYIVEEGSNLLFDNSIILNKEKNVYDKLYPTIN